MVPFETVQFIGNFAVSLATNHFRCELDRFCEIDFIRTGNRNLGAIWILSSLQVDDIGRNRGENDD